MFAIFVLFVALTISAVAAFYSIAGLTAIFAAAVTPIIIMGAALEIGKIVATVWLHKYWNKASLQFKIYLIPAIIVLMLITSMGIFGYLSKAHLDQNMVGSDVIDTLAVIEEKIKTQKDNIDAAKRSLKQMDESVDQTVARSTSETSVDRAVRIRKSQNKERSLLRIEIETAQKEIAKFNEERAPIAAKVRKVEAEVGPIKYIAALIYGDNPDTNLLEKSVRWVIILLIFVFDPLAVVLILAADQTIEWSRSEQVEKSEKTPSIRRKKDYVKLDDVIRSSNHIEIDEYPIGSDVEVIDPIPEDIGITEDQIKDIIEQLMAKKLEFKSLDKVTQDIVLKHTNYTEKRRLFE